MFAAALTLLAAATLAQEGAPAVSFPTERPAGASFPRPHPDEVLDLSPPGFGWWRAGERGAVRYRLIVTGADGKPAYQSALLDDPVCVPDQVLPAGRYSWTVEAVDAQGRVADRRPTGHFTIADNAIAQPWVEPAQLLARVPREHPRLLFPKAQLEAVRATLATRRKVPFESLKREADRGLELSPPPEPTYDKMTDASERRMAYQTSFGDLRRYHTAAMPAMALMYALTGERKYGEAAKALLLAAAEWDPEGISSIMAPYGDEVGLGLVRAGAQSYDWIYDLLDDGERAKAKAMLIARADQMLRRLTRRDYLYRPEESHAGRLPGYLMEHAVALAEEPQAAVWLDYALKAAMTIFPHWAGQDGGWAEGVPYGLAYNTIYLTPFEGLRTATGLDLWQRPFYRRVRQFFLYNISPVGEIRPFGDMEEGSVTSSASSINALMSFHALRYRDAAARAWCDLLKDSRGRPADVNWLPGIILADDLEPGSLDALPPDAVFHGVGWAALHTDLAHPERDLMVSFKSSPYGGVSHSHADQNGFAIMKGGSALAIPGGARWPTHGSPFHTKYVQQTVAHNCLLVDGEGQISRDGNKGGRIVGFESTPHLAYVCGDATACYGDRLARNRRHVVLVRPSVIVMVDEVSAPQPVSLKWLLHGRDRFAEDEAAQRLVSARGGESMTVRLFTPGGFGFEQTDAWPMDPKEGFPTVTAQEPDKQWHFTATTRGKSAARRVAAVMLVDEDGRAPDAKVETMAEEVVVTGEGATVRIALDPSRQPVVTAEHGEERIEAVR